MAHFAKVINSRVVAVIVASEQVIASGRLGPANIWVQTSYNTQQGQHQQGGTPLRKNFAGVGMIYDAERDAFYWPRPEDGTTWVLDEEKCIWTRPQPCPEPSEPGRFVHWSEADQTWIETSSPFGV